MEKNCEFVFDKNIVKKGEEYIDGVLSDIGRHVTSLTLKCACRFNDDYSCNRVMNSIDCKNIIVLHIDDIGKECQNDMLRYNFDNVEVLTLKSSLVKWKESFIKNFIQQFRKLKSLRVLWAEIRVTEWETLFRNNSDIESCLLRRTQCPFDCKSVELIPKVKTLLLDNYDWHLNNINALQTLHQITKLQVNCEMSNVNDLIGALAKNGIMEEVELGRIKVDDKFFDILKTFDRLKLLSLEYAELADEDDDDDDYEPKDWKLTKNFTGLPQLKYLRLQSFEFTFKTFISTIQQLKSLEKFDLCGCSIARNDMSKFKDAAKLTERILETIEDSNRQQRLNVVMPERLKLGKSHSVKKLKESDKLRVFEGGFGSNLLEIEIKLP